MGLWSFPGDLLVGFVLAWDATPNPADSTGERLLAVGITALALLVLVLACRMLVGRAPAAVCAGLFRSGGVLLGASVGGWSPQASSTWAVLFAAGVLGGYWIAVSQAVVQGRAGRVSALRAWGPGLVAAVGALVVTVQAFWRAGLAAISPWLSLWLLLWISARTVSLGQALRTRPGPQPLRQASWELRRGMLMLQAVILAALLSGEKGVIAFAVFFVLFPASALLRRRVGC